MSLRRLDSPHDRRLYAVAFGRVLEELRLLNKLSKEEAAERVGVTGRTWARYERGSKVPYMEEILYYAVKFNVKAIWIFEKVLEYKEEEALKQG